MRLRLIILSLALSAGGICAQEFITSQPERHEVVPETIITPRPSIEGIVKDIFVTKKPWQLVNPAAPKKYGTGEKKVSKDFGPGTPYKSAGWIVLGVEW